MKYFMLHKPRGCFCARLRAGRLPTVYDHVPAHFPRLPHVGRLDVNTEGLLLFTDDGQLAQALLNHEFATNVAGRPLAPVEKVYHVKIRGLLREGEGLDSGNGPAAGVSRGHCHSPSAGASLGVPHAGHVGRGDYLGGQESAGSETVRAKRPADCEVATRAIRTAWNWARCRCAGAVL